jgi:hypothetical protein
MAWTIWWTNAARSTPCCAPRCWSTCAERQKPVSCRPRPFCAASAAAAAAAAAAVLQQELLLARRSHAKRVAGGSRGVLWKGVRQPRAACLLATNRPVWMGPSTLPSALASDSGWPPRRQNKLNLTRSWRSDCGGGVRQARLPHTRPVPHAHRKWGGSQRLARQARRPRRAGAGKAGGAAPAVPIHTSTTHCAALLHARHTNTTPHNTTPHDTI